MCVCVVCERGYTPPGHGIEFRETYQGRCTAGLSTRFAYSRRGPKTSARGCISVHTTETVVSKLYREIGKTRTEYSRSRLGLETK